ncbi:TrkH family potassium uptake protein [Tomitella fengzijianii]|nr:potassium transporter TrkG [Tomitella fengzijianii]
MTRRALGAQHPARFVVLGFAGAVVVGTLLLMLPVATADGTAAAPLTALFTATSAVCVTGLVVVDTAGYWSTFGEVVIVTLIQIGGLGIMALASLLGLLVARRIGLRMRLAAQTETKATWLGDSRRVVLGVIRLSITVEVVVAALLTLRFALHYDEPIGRAAYLGVFHAVSAYNNAGFALWSDSLTRFAADPWIIAPISAAIIVGGLGFPVVIEVIRAARRRLRREPHRPHWSLHTKITLITYGLIALIGIIAITGIEWSNPRTLGPLDSPGSLLAGAFSAISPRTAGFNAVDVGAMHPATLLITDVMMFIGGGSAGTAGGIKVTTFALLAFVIITEARGEPTVHVMGRRLAGSVQRQAVSVALLGVGAVFASAVALMLITPYNLNEVLFEATSAFATVGLTTGITADLPDGAQLILIGLMFVGRLGPITFASALALRERGRRYELPEERPIVG